jgi:branched-chain amino acid transport system permease protein
VPDRGKGLRAVLSYLIAGLVSGSVYAISSLGIVLTYNASRTFNFAQGGMAFFIAYCFHWLTVAGVPPALALAICVLGIAPALGLALWAVLLGRLSSATPMARIAAMIGLSVALTAATTLIFGDGQVFEPRGVLSSSQRVFSVSHVAVSQEQLLIVGTAAALAVLGYVILCRTTTGLVIRGTVDSPAMSALSGTNPNVVVAVTWMVGVSIAGLIGILITPQVGLNATSFDTIIAASFAGVVIGRMTNIWWAFAGSLLVGVVQSIVVPWLPSSGFLATSLQPSLPFAVMVLAILFHSLTRGGVTDERQTREVASMSSTAERNLARTLALLRTRDGRWDRYVGFAALPIVAVAIPLILPGFWVGVVALGLCYAVVLLSFRLVTGEAGIVGLCQITFAGIGAVMTAQFATEHDLPVLVAILVAALVAFGCGLVVGVVALPLGQLYAAVVTFAFALLADQTIFTRPEFSNFGSGVAVNRPSLFGTVLNSNTQYYWFAGAVFLLLTVVLWGVRRSNLGLKFATIRASRNRAATLGIAIYRYRLLLFGCGAMIAGLGGGLLGSNNLVAFPGEFAASLGLTWFAVAVAQGPWSMGGAAAAGLSLAIFPALFSDYLPARLGDLPTMLFGLMAIQMVANPIGINPQLRATVRSLAIRAGTRRGRPPSGTPAPDSVPARKSRLGAR